MKGLLFISLLLQYVGAAAQNTVTSYYDVDWGLTSKERSYYYTTFVKEGATYKATSYYSKGDVVAGRFVFPDTIMAKPIGNYVTYYKSGKTQDAVLFQPDGKLLESFHFHENGELGGHYYIIETTKKEVTEGFDENGIRLKNYILSREAEFKGGDAAWLAYLAKAARKDILVRGKEQQTVTVQLQFAIDGAGNVTNVTVLKSSGVVLVDKDAVGIVTSSPPWQNAIQYNKPVKVYRIQPITYVLEPMQKK